MARQERQQLALRPQVQLQQGGRQVRQQVAASSTDALPSYIPQQKNSDLEGFVQGLSQFQPSLNRMMQEAQVKESKQAEADSLGGIEAQSSSPSYTQAYFHTEGITRGTEDASSLVQRYNTEFDKDTGDIEKWLGEQYQGRLKGITDGNYIEGYNKALVPALEGIRNEHLKYHRQAAEGRVESNAMQMLTGGLKSYLTSGDGAVPSEYISSVRDYLGKNLGVSSQRFDELTFEAAKSLGNEGHFDAFELLKRDHPDGSPGLYNNPAWRQKIEDAMAHSANVAFTRGQRMRDEQQETKLYEVFAEEDPKKAQAMFQEMKKSGLFSRASDLIKWEKLMYEKVDGKPDANQLDKEGALLSRVYQGGVSYKELLAARARGDITASQQKYLFSETRRVQNENRADARAAASQESAVYRSREFKDGEDFLKRILKPRPSGSNDLFGNGSEFDQANLAQAHRELGRAVAGKKPEEVGPIVDEITNRYKKRQDGYNKDQQDRVGRGQVPFRSLAEAKDAASKGLLSPAEFRTYIDYFKDQQ